MESSYKKNLIMKVINNSQSNCWNEAVLEWDINDYAEDLRCSSKCICGKENIRYLYSIKNRYNGRILFPIGSSCINKFNRDDLKKQTKLIEEQFNLLHNEKSKKYLSLSSNLFSKKLLKWLYDEGAFDTAYNNYNGVHDYEFILKMFLKKRKDKITIKQDKKIKAILVNSIRPFLRRKLDGKIFETKD